ncbi:MAG: ABC transporter permease [Cyclobacteriaceae bacterium]
MIRNYITIALRSMMRHKTYSVINTLGLSVGVSCCLLLALYIRHEVSYDRQHRDLDRLYQVTSIMGDVSENKIMRTTSAPIVWGIKDELPEIEKVTRLVNPPGVSQNLIRYGQNQFYESDGYIADSTLFDIFTYSFVSGNPKKALVEANSVVITESLAKKIFGDQPALNQVISINQGGPVADFKVTGVLADKQGRSHIGANFFVSMTSSGWAEFLRSPSITEQWAGQNFLLSYIKLRPGHSAEEFLPKMNKVFLKYGADDLKTLGMKKSLGLQPVKDIYLYATYGGRTARITFLYVIGSIAVFILLIPCINFMNLSTAKATRRAGEVGLRKTLGAQRSVLIRQFLGETLVIVIFAVFVSLIMVQILLPLFNHVIGKTIAFSSENVTFIALTLISITLLTGVVAGSYPAFYLSSFQPATALKGKLSLNNSGNLLRKSLVVFQFVIAITLVCCMVTVTKQLNFMQDQNLGFNSDNKLILPLRTQATRDRHQALHRELASLSPVKNISASAYTPGLNILNDFSLYREGSSMDASVNVKNSWVEPNYMDLLNIQLVTGRKFTANRLSESKDKIILNETAVKNLGFEPAEIIGKHVYNDHSNGRSSFEVIGVMEDYHQITLKEEIYPLLFRVPEDETYHNFMVLDIAGENFGETISDVEKVWKNLNPETPFEFTFLDETINRQYDEDRKVSSVMSGFTAVAVIICCLGLFGLSSYMAERRVKEIGVRKVFGASVTQIVNMMSGEFIRLVSIALSLSVPLAWYLIQQWLDDFAYKAPVGIMIFVYAGVSALCVAVLTVSYESLRAASGNPVHALRNE